MAYKIESKELPEQPALVKRGLMPAEMISTWLPQAYMELFRHLQKEHVAPGGPPYARYTMDGEIEVEAGVPVTTPVPAEGELTMSALPAGTVVTTLHVGRYEDMTGSYEALKSWISENGKEPTGVYWETYLTDPAETPDPEQQQTVLFMGYR